MATVCIDSKGSVMSKSQNEKIKHYYNESQIFYDIFWMNKRNLAMHYGYWEKSTKNRNEALLNENKYVEKLLDIQESDIVLDAGCGVGGTAIEIAEKYGAKVVGIGLVEKQNEAAKNNSVSRNVNELVTFEIGDFNKTRFEDETFTKIYAIESTCHSENKREFIKEAVRLLKPGGKFVVCDYFVNRLKDTNDESDYSTFCRGWAMANLSGKTDYENSLMENHFNNIVFNDYTKYALKSSLYMRNLALLWLPIDLTLHLFKIISDDDLAGTKASISQYNLFKGGALMHGIFSATKIK